jgi:hypothetical protein
MNISSALGGLAGACALTLLNESIKRIDKNAPRLDLLGQNAAAKLMKGNDLVPHTLQQYFPLAGDIVTNSLYFAMAKGESKANTYVRGALLGLSAGIGALSLPKPLGLEEEHTTKATTTKVMTIAWYLIGGLIAAAVMNAMNKDTEAEPEELKNGIIHDAQKAGKKIIQEA